MAKTGAAAGMLAVAGGDAGPQVHMTVHGTALVVVTVTVYVRSRSNGPLYPTNDSPGKRNGTEEIERVGR